MIAWLHYELGFTVDQWIDGKPPAAFARKYPAWSNEAADLYDITSGSYVRRELRKVLRDPARVALIMKTIVIEVTADMYGANGRLLTDHEQIRKNAIATGNITDASDEEKVELGLLFDQKNAD